MENKTKTAAACGGGDDDPDPLLLLLLPEEVLIQILVRLPIQSLLRFKSVCKSWRALIQTSFFIHLHITATTTSSSNFGTFIIKTDNLSTSSKNDVILMLSSEEKDASEYGSQYDGDWYRCADGCWHKFTTGGGGVGSWHKFWYNTNWDSDSDSDSDSDDDGGDWHWDNTNWGWYWVSDGRDWLWESWDDTNGCWYWVGDDDDVDKDDQELFNDDQLFLKVDNLEHPSCYKLTNTVQENFCKVPYSRVIAGTCNGLICLHDSHLKDVSLWNPVTRQFRILPKSITIEIDDDDFIQHIDFLPKNKQGIDFVAFGFDVKTKDYKVLLITCFTLRHAWTPKYFCRAQLYSLSTDSWRLLEGSLVALPTEYHGLYLNGSCFFIAKVYHPESNSMTRFIHSFDFTKEIFTTMQLPDHDPRQDLILRCLGGEKKMALFTALRKTSSGEYKDNNYDRDGYEECDIWVLNEYGGVNKESWTKLHSFQIQNSIRGLPIGISNNGKFAFLETTEALRGRRIQLYNLVTKEVKLDIPFCLSMSEVYVYNPSLVSIIGGNGAAAASPAIG